MQSKSKSSERSRYLKSPWLESIIMALSAALSFICLTVLSMAAGDPAPGEMATSSIALIFIAFFVLSCIIAMVAVIAGIGGGVIFTPIMLAFTSVNSLIVRGTGLIVAMFSGPISIGVFTKKRLANYCLNLIMTLSQALGALAGAMLAVRAAESAGIIGEGLLRFGLGIILLSLAVFFLCGGKKSEFPDVTHADRFTKRLRLDGIYYEESDGTEHSYKVKRAPLGIFLLFAIGILGGFFGMGGGWAITPALNLGMGLPLKLAAVNSNVILGLGGGVSIWPYVFAGGIIPLFVLPWMAGQVVGGFIGAHILVRIKVNIVRLILIGIMIFTSFTLVTRGLEMVGLIGAIPPLVQVIVFTLTMAGIFTVIFLQHAKKRESDHA